MIAQFYATLQSFGFTHPLHPMLVHLPMGMIVGAVVFSLAAVRWPNSHLRQTAGHCAILALIGIGPTIAAGTMDWLHRYGGLWQPLIVAKFALAGLLTALLALAVWRNSCGDTPGRMCLYYLLCLACAGGLGFAGGELVYG